MKTKGILRQKNTLYCCVLMLLVMYFFSCEKVYVVEGQSDVLALIEEYKGIKAGSLMQELNYVMLYGPERFERENGKSQNVEVDIVVDNFKSVAGPFRLYLRNGDGNKEKAVSNIVVKIDGKVVLGNNNFSNKVNYYMVEVELTANSKLEVEVNGEPDSYVEIFITGRKVGWAKCYGGLKSDKAFAMEKTSDGGCVVVGESYSIDGDVSQNNGAYDIWIIKLDSVGELEWEKSYGGRLYETPECVIQTADGGYAIAGYTNSDDLNSFIDWTDYWVIKLDSNGDLEWQKCYGGTKIDIARSIIQTSDGGYMVAGQTSSSDVNVSFNNGYVDCWLIKLDENGGIIWEKSYGGMDLDICSSLIATKDGGFAMAGYSTELSGSIRNLDYWIMKVDEAGVLLWEKYLGSDKSDRPSKILETRDEELVVIGYSYLVYGDKDLYLVKLNNNGDLLAQKYYGGLGSDSGSDIIQTADDGFVISGSFESINRGYDYCVIKLDKKMNIEWQNYYGGTSSDNVCGIIQIDKGGYVVAGSSYSTDGEVVGNHGSDDFWIIKIDDNGELILP